MALSLGTVVGQIRIDIAQAMAAYEAVRAQHLKTVTTLNTTGTAFRQSGLVMAAAGGVMVGAFVAAAGAAAEFEKRIDFFGAVSNTTQKDLEGVSAKALQLGKDTKFSANEIADSFIELGKSGVSARDIIDGVGEAVANLGASADIPLADAANIITSQLQAFGLGAKDAVHVANELQGAANASIADVQDLGVSLKYVGGVAAAVHVPFESTVDAISLLAKAGIRGSTAGTSLRQILVSLQGNSAKATAKLKELGIITADGTNKFIDQQGHIKPLAEVFQILQDATSGLTEAQRLQAFKIIFNNRALAAANILTAQGAKGFAEMNKAIAGTTAADVAAKRMDNLSGDIEILRGNIETLLIQAGTPFQNFLRGIVQGLTGVIQFFGNLPAPIQTAIFAFLGLAGAALVIMGTVNIFLGTLFTFGSNLLRLAGIFNFLKTIIFNVRVAMTLLNLTFLTNPIFLVIAAIVAIIAILVVLYNKSETFRNAVNAIGSALLTAFKAVFSFFAGLPSFFSGVWNSMTGAISGFLNWVRSNWPTILAIITGPLGLIVLLVVKFKDQIIGFFKTLWDGVAGATTSGVGWLIQNFTQLPEKIAYWLGFLVGRTVRIWIDMWAKIYQVVTAGINGTVNFFAQLPGRIIAFHVALFTRAYALWLQFWAWLRNAVVVGLQAVFTFFAQLPGRIGAFFSAAYQQMVLWMTTAWNVTRARAAAIVSGIISFIATLPARIGAFFSSVYNTIVRWLNAAVNWARTSGRNIVSGIMSAITGLPGLIGGVFSRAIGAISNFAGAALDKARSIGSSIWNGFKAGLGINSPSYLERAMFQITDTIGSETDRMKKQVGTLQGLGRSLAEKNPVTAYSSAIKGGYGGVAAPAMARAVTSVAGAGAVPAQRSGSTPGLAGGAQAGGKTFNVTVNNPVPEKAGTSLYKAHQKLIYLDGDE